MHGLTRCRRRVRFTRRYSPWCSQRLRAVSPALQSALVHVNTLLVQQVLADPKWADTLTDADRRALSPLFWTHVIPIPAAGSSWT
ncbi:Tn3 family transposase [Streptomyces sp. NPDC004042]|uniref:Tn3 family transposase n=1 Tax=Streptomyces sp. NPDC004042 TaxID=3154451 RepID=UPI0033AC4B28